MAQKVIIFPYEGPDNKLQVREFDIDLYGIRELFESDELWMICKSKSKKEIQVKQIADCKNFDKNAFPAEGEYMDADEEEFEEEISILKKRI